MAETVNHPPHYNAGKIEVIDAIEDWGLGFHDGNVVKYVARCKHKNGVEDLRKAAWYLQRLIEQETKKAKGTDVDVTPDQCKARVRRRLRRSDPKRTGNAP